MKLQLPKKSLLIGAVVLALVNTGGYLIYKNKKSSDKNKETTKSVIDKPDLATVQESVEFIDTFLIDEDGKLAATGSIANKSDKELFLRLKVQVYFDGRDPISVDGSVLQLPAGATTPFIINTTVDFAGTTGYQFFTVDVAEVI